MEGREAGRPPPVALGAERRTGDFVRAMIRGGLVAACHDLSDGGLLAALAEMAMAGMRGMALGPFPSELPLHAYLFGEDQARYVIETPDPHTMLTALTAAPVPPPRTAPASGPSSPLTPATAPSLLHT